MSESDSHVKSSIVVSIDPRKQKTKEILDELIEIVRKCQTKYGGKKELATEKDSIIIKLCDIWEKAFSYGLKIPQSSVLKNMQEMVSGINNNEEYTFWEFSQNHLTKHEKERFAALQNVWTNRGRIKAFIRAALNERSLERYILMFLGDSTLKDFYENWSLMRDLEAVNLLPSIAAGLSSILFAITIDTSLINIVHINGERQEPIISAPKPIKPSKKSIAVNRQIVTFDTEPITDIKTSTINKSTIHDSPKDQENVELSLDSKITETRKISNGYLIDNPLESTIIQEERIADIVSSKELNYEHTMNSEYLYIKNEPSPSDIATDFSKSSSEYSFPSHGDSLKSSTSSVSQQIEVNHLENNLKEMAEKCAFLEAKVSELSLENRRLCRLLNQTNKDINFIITIPKVIPQGSGPRKYYAYQIHINSKNGLDNWIILRRYREFYKLHQNMQRSNQAIKLLDFPPKKKIGNLDTLFVEDRRQRLQIYLKNVLTLLPEISSCKTKTELQAVFPFLK